jgi:hypothetical protein
MFNGISQQAAPMRLGTQVEEMLNMYPDIVEGVQKRASTHHIAELFVPNLEVTSHIHRIHRDAYERYLVFFTNDATNPITVVDLQGNQKTVTYEGNAKQYITSGADTPREKFSIVTIADHSFISNKTVTVGMLDDLLEGSILDSYNRFSKLPDGKATSDGGTGAFPPVGSILQVNGDDGNKFKRYYVKYTGSHAYEECAKPKQKYKLDADTMPHIMVRNADGTFTVKPAEWGERKVGDNVTATEPSFVGYKVRHVTFFKNRLCFFTDQNVVFSRASFYYDFFPSTVIDLLDDDPIDIGVAGGSGTVTNLQSSAVFDKTLLAFSLTEQFVIGSGQENLTPSTATSTGVTAFEIVEGCDPVTIGANVYFPSPNNEYTTVREYFVQPDSYLNDAADVTAHCNRFIPKGKWKFIPCSPLDLLMLHDADRANEIYAYKFRWQGSEKVQSAWNKWTFSGDVVGAVCFETELYVVIKRDAKFFLEKMYLSIADHPILKFPIHLDRQVTVNTGSYDIDTDITTWTLPYEVTEAPVVVVENTGLEIPFVEFVDSTTLRASGDYSDSKVIVGEAFVSKIVMTEPNRKDANGNPVLDDRIRMRGIHVRVKNTSTFSVEYYHSNRLQPAVVRTRGLSAAMYGHSHYGAVPFTSAAIRVGLSGTNVGLRVALINESYLPSSFVSAIWEMEVVRKT